MKTFITSFNNKLLNQYGRQFLIGWDANAASDVELIVCYEGNIDEIDENELNGNRYRIIPIESEIQQFFLRKFGKLRELRGFQYNQGANNENLSITYNYRYDAIRFSFKIFSFLKCKEKNLLKNDFAWIDSDVICKQPFASSDLSELFPDSNQLASYLGRKTFPSPNPYSECGFVGYNYNHPLCINFITEMLEMYISGNFLLLKEWHDCMIFDFMRSNYSANKGVIFKDLAQNFPNSKDPFSESKLSIFFDHLKGPIRKAELQNHSKINSLI